MHWCIVSEAKQNIQMQHTSGALPRSVRRHEAWYCQTLWRLGEKLFVRLHPLVQVQHWDYLLLTKQTQ